MSIKYTIPVDPSQIPTCDKDKIILASILEKVSGLLDGLYEYAEDDEEQEYICEVESELYSFCKSRNLI